MSDDHDPTAENRPASHQSNEPELVSEPTAPIESAPDRGGVHSEAAVNPETDARTDARTTDGAPHPSPDLRLPAPVSETPSPVPESPVTEAEAQQPASRTATLWLVVFGLSLLLGAGAALWRASNDSSVASGDRAGTVAPGESEAADFADRKPANPGGGALSDSVTLSVGDWTEAGFVGAVVSKVIEELGYQVRRANPMGPDQAYNALASGQVDIWADAWLPAHEPYLAIDTSDGERVGDRVQTITTTTAGGVMGIFVTTDWAEANSVSTVEDVLALPDAGTVFDLTGDGIPDFYGCNPTWGCAETINEVIRERGWRISQYAGDYDASVQSAIDRAESGEPALVFTWLPSTYGDELAIADGRFSLLGVAGPSDGDAVTATPCLADPCVTGFAVDDLGMATSRSFVAAHPDIAGVLDAVRIPQGDISAALGAIAQGETMDAQADAWIETHRSEVDTWLAAGA